MGDLNLKHRKAISLDMDVLDASDGMLFARVPQGEAVEDLYMIVHEVSGALVFQDTNKQVVESIWNRKTGRAIDDFGMGLHLKYCLRHKFFKALTSEFGYCKDEEEQVDLLMLVVSDHIRKSRKMVSYLRDEMSKLGIRKLEKLIVYSNLFLKDETLPPETDTVPKVE
nr:hypothetical protein [uncultured Sphaerochaeta sp.]